MAVLGAHRRVGQQRLTLQVVVACSLVFLAGCSTAPVPQDGDARAHRAVAKPPGARKPAERPPFAYEPLSVRNSCFVESVHFYDEYQRRQRPGGEGWARVLQWGNTEGDFKMGQGHAVTVYAHAGRLWFYDVNFGVQRVDVGIERRGDIHDVSPEVFRHYPQYQPVLARYREDYQQQPAPRKVEHLFYHKNADVRDVTRVASQLGKWRPVAVFEFDLKQGGKKVPTAGVAFVFGARVCIYFPRGGTHVSPPFAGSMDDLRYIRAVVKRLYPGSDNIRWQPGGYLLFPPKEKR